MIDDSAGDRRTVPGPWFGLAVAALLAAQLLGWLPHYLFWPYWADHDVFANAARAWSTGQLPYRDVRLNQFPGTVYLFALLGRTVGWGRPWAFFAADAGLLLAFGATLLAWSRRRLGRFTPGLIGFAAVVSLLLGLDYSHAGQRDWHAPALAVLALLVIQTAEGSRWAFGLAAALAALAFTVRPQVILLGPALVWSVGTLDPDRPPGRAIGRAARWLALAAVLAALLFVPLVVAGIGDDFVRSLRLVAPGSGYNRGGILGAAKRWAIQGAELRWWAVAASVLILMRDRSGADRRLGVATLLALAGASLYQPLSPVNHSYLEIPLAVVGSVALALAVGWAGDPRVGPAAVRWVAVLALVAAGGVRLLPDFVEVGPAIAAIRALRAGQPLAGVPAGYRHGRVASAGFYPWADYAAALAYLRERTDPTTGVANLLLGDPAVVGMVDRPSALPAESVAWLRMVRPEDQADFARSLEDATNSVVLWVPGEVGPDPAFRIDDLAAVVRRLYHPAAKFGAIEVWTRQSPP